MTTIVFTVENDPQHLGQQLKMPVPLYQWYRDGQPLNGETSPTHIVNAFDLGHVLTIVSSQIDEPLGRM